MSAEIVHEIFTSLWLILLTFFLFLLLKDITKQVINHRADLKRKKQDLIHYMVKEEFHFNLNKEKEVFKFFLDEIKRNKDLETIKKEYDEKVESIKKEKTKIIAFSRFLLNKDKDSIDQMIERLAEIDPIIQKYYDQFKN